MIECILNSMLQGKLDRGLASTAGYLAQGLLRALEGGELEQRLAVLEAKLRVRT
jgi:hypothetical protein